MMSFVGSANLKAVAVLGSMLAIAADRMPIVMMNRQ